MRVVAIIGRPNVGKSTLFNRLAGKPVALVDDSPGVTRDRREGDARLGELRFRIIDTAGLEEAASTSLEARMFRQTEQAIAQCDICIFMMDGRAGVTAADRHFASHVRRSGKPVILLANKAEKKAAQSGVYDGFSLGLGEPLAISAAHGDGLDHLHAALSAGFARLAQETGQSDVSSSDRNRGERPLRLAVIGRPNAGKSTLINHLLGQERLLTGPEAGVTRDAIGVPWRWRDREVVLWDTAGIRRKARITSRLEKLSVADGRRAIDFAEVVILVLDARQALERQDINLAFLAMREGRPVIFALNKWDQVAQKKARLRELSEKVETALPQFAGAALIPLSALTGWGLAKLMPEVVAVHERWNKRISTARLNAWLAARLAHHPPPMHNARPIKLRYITQVASRPPAFAVFSSFAGKLPHGYERYLINGLRSEFGFAGVPVRLYKRSGSNPYA